MELNHNTTNNQTYVSYQLGQINAHNELTDYDYIKYRYVHNIYGISSGLSKLTKPLNS